MNLEKKIFKQRMTSNEIPTAQQSEMYVIGAAMLMEGAVQKIFEVLRHWHFYFEDNALIWKAIHRLLRTDKVVNKDFVYMELHKKAFFDKEIEVGYLLQCIEVAGNGLEAVQMGTCILHRELVFETWSRRQMIDLGATIQFYGFIPSGHTAKVMEVFDQRKQRIEQAYALGSSLQDMKSCRFDPSAPIVKEDYVLNFHMDGHTYGIAEKGCIVSISGGSGSRKTTLLSALLASAYRPGTAIGFDFQHRQGKVLFFDTEQPEKRFQHTQRRLFDMAQRKNTPDVFEAYTLRGKSVKERIHFIDKIIHLEKSPIAAIVIDGILDLVEHMNDLVECTAIIQRLMTWTEETGAVLFPVLHDMRSTGKMGGHLGSFLERKQDAEINVNLAEDPDCSDVRFRKTRGGRKPRGFQFTQNNMGWPVLALPIVQIKSTGTDDVPF